jgi:hypothetical protein
MKNKENPCDLCSCFDYNSVDYSLNAFDFPILIASGECVYLNTPPLLSVLLTVWPKGQSFLPEWKNPAVFPSPLPHAPTPKFRV